MNRPLGFLIIAGLAMTTASANFLAIDSSNDRVLMLDRQTGAVLRNDFIVNTPEIDFGTPKGIVDTGTGEIWISNQIRNFVARFDYGGNFIGKIGGDSTSGLSNLRGLRRVGNEIWLTNSGTANGAPGPSIIRFSLTGERLGHFATVGSPFDVLPISATEVLISSSTSNTIERYSIETGQNLGTFSQTPFSFPQQMHLDGDGILVATFSLSGQVQRGVVRLNMDGTLDEWVVTGPAGRGVYRLGNGDAVFTDGLGVAAVDPNGQIYDLAAGFSAQYITETFAPVPEPATMIALGAGAGLLAWRRRRSPKH